MMLAGIGPQLTTFLVDVRSYGMTAKIMHEYILSGSCEDPDDNDSMPRSCMKLQDEKSCTCPGKVVNKISLCAISCRSYFGRARKDRGYNLARF